MGKTYNIFGAEVAQVVEQRTENPRVSGSTPLLGTRKVKMAKLSEKAMELFNDHQAMKVMAAVDAADKPHLTPKGTMMAIDDETIAYSEMAGGRAKANL